MSFTEEERAAWHAARRRGSAATIDAEGPPRHVCLHCGNAFGVNEGTVTEEAALCDVCNGD
ncbi:MAG: hypothetical protein E7773_14920 [Sphingomonas sp.]|uniref:hypothetical protein n=1 Tax=Sphingomonas sp. TaxID=28214 RepID=UPI001208FE8A|nr:hypothetical protein [Sphingomonas sp.]THD34479.1 MAG: hypothetical protein E7773_14920 [Sphingomonas sp.]